MKTIKIAIVALVCCVAALSTSAQTQYRYYFYPSSNIYYDVSGRQYVFNQNGSWTTAKTLPSGITLIKGDRRVTVIHPNKDVWNDNDNHKVKYKHSNANRSSKMKRGNGHGRGRSKH